MKCPKCGTVVPDKDKLCEMCGADLTDPVLLASQEPAKPKHRPAPTPAAEAPPPAAPPAAAAVPPPAASPPEAPAPDGGPAPAWLASAPTPSAPPPPPPPAPPSAPAAPAAAATPAAPVGEGKKPCAGCGEVLDHHAMKIIAGRPYCPTCEVKLIDLAQAGAQAPSSTPPGMVPCAGCGHPKGPKQLKEIGGALYCVNCERNIVSAFQSGAVPGAAAAARPKPERPRQAPSDTSTNLTEEELAEREERKRTLAEARLKEQQKELSRRIESGLTRWPEVTLPPELEPPKDAEALRERPAPTIPEMKFPNTGGARAIWGPAAGVMVLAGLVFLVIDIGGTWGKFMPVFAGVGLLVCLYFLVDSFGGVRVDTKGIWKDSAVAKKRIFWSSMRAVELVQQPLTGLGFLKGLFARLDLVFTFTDGRKNVFPIGTVMGKPCVKDFEGLKKHFKMGALANAIKIVERSGGA